MATGTPNRAASRGAEREVVPAQVDGEGHGARRRVHAAGDADADRERGRRAISPASASAASSASAIRLDRVRGVPGAGRDDVAPDRGQVPVREDDRDLAAADVDAGEDAARHRAGTRPSSRVMSRALAPSSTVSSAAPPTSIRVSRRQQREGAPGRLVADRVEPRLAEVGHAAEQDDVVDVERADERRHRPAQPAARCGGDAPGFLVAVRTAAATSSIGARAGVGQPAGQRARRVRGGGLDRLLDDGPRAGDGLEAAEPAAAALDAVVDDRGVADLAGAEAVALEQLPAEHDPGADAVPDLDGDEVGRPAADVEQVLAHGGGAGVVGDERRAGRCAPRGSGPAGGPASRG